MSYTRADIRNLIRDAIDPASSDFTDGQLDDWIAEAVLEVSPLLPVEATHTETLTGDTITLTGRASQITSVLIDGDYWDPIHRTHPSFAEQNAYHIELTSNETNLILGASQTAVSITIIYFSDTTQTDSDGADFALDDTHAHIIVARVVATAYIARHAIGLVDGDDLALVSRHLTVAEDDLEEFHLALAAAVEEFTLAQEDTQP